MCDNVCATSCDVRLQKHTLGFALVALDARSAKYLLFLISFESDVDLVRGDWRFSRVLPVMTGRILILGAGFSFDLSV